MTASLFPDFEEKFVDTGEFRLFARVGGAGAPVLLLHGFPQTHACWHPLAWQLAKRHRVVCIDMPGYGLSSAPGGDAAHRRYSKRHMGECIVNAMEKLGHDRFAIVGHDRGARVGYRVALDAGSRITRLALLDIIPTFYVWRKVEEGVFPAAHWDALARAWPEPENKIARDPVAYFDTLTRRWTADGTLNCFHPVALEDYHVAQRTEDHVHAFCEDYRAGASIDRMLDEADFEAGRTIACSVLAVSSKRFYLTSGTAGGAPSTLDAWHETFAPNASGAEVDAGHFLMEENPSGTLAALTPFLSEEP